MRFATLAAALALAAPAGALAKTTVIHADAVVTDAEAPVRGKSTVIVTDGRIVSVEDGWVGGPAGAEMVHLAGKTLVPGLTDLHVHLTGDPGGDFWKEAVEPED
jgi:imidazolonepropionase-like amidohydrolase